MDEQDSQTQTAPPPPGAVLVKKQSTAPPPGAIPVKKDFTHGYQPTPEDLKVKKSYDDLEKSFDAKPVPGLQDALNAYHAHLSPQDHAEYQRAQQAIANKPPDTIRQTTKKEQDAQHAMDTTMGKIGKSMAYIGSETTKGGVDVLKGGAWVLNHLNTNLYDTQLIPDKAFKGIDEATDLGVTKGQRAQIEGDKGLGMGATRTLGMIGNLAPAAIGGEEAGIPKTMFALQGFGQGKDQMDVVDPDHKLNPAVRDLYIAGTGAVNGLIMGDLGEGLLSKPVQEKVVSGIVSHAVADAAEKGLTEDAVKESAKTSVKDFSNKFYELAEKTGKTGVDLSALQAAQYAMKKGVDVTSPEPVFNANLGELMSNISDVVTKQAPLFGGVGAMLGGAEKDPNEVAKRSLGEQVQQKDADIAKYSEKTDDPVKNAENEVNLEQAKKDREELNNQLKNVILKQKDNEQAKNEGDAGHPAETEKTNGAAQQAGKNERAVHPEWEHGQEGVKQGGEEPPLTKAVDAVTHGIVVPENIMGRDPSARFDFDMTTAEKQKAVRDIKAGNYKTAPAKKMLSKLQEWEKNDEYPIIEGLGGSSKRRLFATAAEIQDHIDQAKANNLGELTPKQIKEVNKPLSELGFTHKDFQDYENYRRTTESASNDVQQPKNDKGSSAPQNTSGETSQGNEKVKEENQDATQKEKPNAIQEPPLTKSFESVKEGDKVTWDVHGNEDPQEWEVGKKVTTRGGKPAVELIRNTYDSSLTGEHISKEEWEKQDPNIRNEPHKTIHIVNEEDFNNQIGENQDATQKEKIQESSGGEHQDRDESGKTPKTSRSDSTVGSEKSEGQETPPQDVKPKPTSIKKVITEATRQEKSLPDVELSKFKGDSPTLEHGKKLIGTGAVKPDEVIDRVVSGKGIYTPDEAAAMQYHMHQLRTAEEDLRAQLDDVNKKLESVPNDENHKKAKDVIIGNLRQLDDRTEEATRANRINSRSWSNLGNTMQIEADHTFSPANIRGIIRDNYGGEIPKDVQTRLDKAIKERDQALTDLKKATENATNKQGKQVVEKIRKSIKLIKQTKAELEAEGEQLKSDLRKALKADFSRVNSGIPIPTETLAVLGKLAVNYFKQGVKDFEGLVNKIHSDLEDTGIDKAQVREYLSNYEPLRDESKARRTELLGRKERSLNKQLETGKLRDYSRKPEITFKRDNEVVKAEQRVKDAEFKIKQEKAKSYNKTKSGTQRALDWLIRWERRFVLSSPAILEKLAAAVTIGGGLKRIPEEAVGGMWTKMLPALMSKAPIEGGFNAKAEATYWKEFSNPKKFLHNSIEILKTGASDLTKEFSDKPHEHYQFYDALTDLHPIIKDISKRSTYEASLVKGLKWAEGQGLDVYDPLIRQNIKQMAYNRAEYEIFQENSGWNRKLQKFLNDERTPKNNKEMLTRFATRFLMPVSTVPLNIARRIGNYATGLPRGLINAREAYKAGIENLTNEQAEIIAKQLKQGTMGAALFSMGLFGIGGAYGGFYNKDDRGGFDRSGPFDPGFDEMYFGKQKVEKPIQHALPLQMIQLGATYRNIYKLYMDKYATSDEYNTELEKQMKSTAQAAMVSAAAIAEQVPLIEEPFELVGAFKDPYMRKKFGESMKRKVTPSILNVFKK